MRKHYLLVKIILLLAYGGFSQSDGIDNIETALRSSSAKELIKFCVDRVEIQIDGEKATYSKPQAEAVLKDFFSKNAAQSFRYVHQGSSPEGLKYTIGSYEVKEGSFRVYMLLKKSDDLYLIDTISFTRE